MSYKRTVYCMPRSTTNYWKLLLQVAIACTWLALLFQGITTALGESRWRRTSQGWEAAADSRPFTSRSSEFAKPSSSESTMVFKSLGLQLDVESVHAGHRMILPVAIAGLIGSLGFWFLLWDRRCVNEHIWPDAQASDARWFAITRLRVELGD